MITMEFEVETREELGSKAVKRLRKEGYIPGVVYGKTEPVNIKIGTRDFIKKTHGIIGDNVLIDLSFKGSKDKRTVVLKELQKDSIKGDFLHLDFSEVSLDKKININVHITLLGEAPGAAQGGILEFHQRDLALECLPKDMLDKIEVDISMLNIGDSLHVRDLKVSDKVKMLTPEDVTVVSVAAPRKEEEAEEEKEAAAEVEGEGQEEPEVIAKGKKEKEEPEPEQKDKAKS